MTHKGESVAKVPIYNATNGIDPSHKYIVPTNKFYGENKDHVVVHLLNEYCGNIKNNRSQWRKDKKNYFCQFKNNEDKWTSKVVNFHVFNNYINSNKCFRFSDFHFPNYNCDWLDLSIDMTLNFIHKDGILVQDYSLKQRFGINIFLQLDREGHMISTLLPQLTIRVVKKRNELIDNSHLALTIDWLLDFKDLINDSISLIDIFLMPFHTKAKYAPNSDWNFDEAKIGSKIGRRVDDKLQWIKLITGKNLDMEKKNQA